MRRTLYDVGFVVLMFSMLSIAVMSVGPWIETKLFPVYSKFRLISAEPVEDGTVAVFEYTKHRACEPQGIEWYIGELGINSQRISVEDGSGTVTSRAPGTYRTSPYVFDATPEQLATDVYAHIFNRCHFAWPTRSEIYP